MNTSLIIGFLLLTAPAFMSPGPNNLMLMISSAKFGFSKTIPHAFGVILGFPFMVFVVGFGLGEIFTLYPIIKIVMKYLAAAYFLWMAWHLLGLKVGGHDTSSRPLLWREAALFQWINPKAWAMAVSFVAAFVEPGPQKLLSVLLVSGGCLALSPISSFGWMVFGVQLQSFLVRTGTERYLGWILAILMCSAVVLFLL